MVLSSLVAAAIAMNGAAQDSAPPSEPPIDYVEEAWKVDGKRPPRVRFEDPPGRIDWFQRTQLDALFLPHLDQARFDSWLASTNATEDARIILQTLFDSFLADRREIAQRVYDERPFRTHRFDGVLREFAALDQRFSTLLNDLTAVLGPESADVERHVLRLERIATLHQLRLFPAYHPMIGTGEDFDLVASFEAFRAAGGEVRDAAAAEELIRSYEQAIHEHLNQSLAVYRESHLRYHVAFWEQKDRDDRLRAAWQRDQARWLAHWSLQDRFIAALSGVVADADAWHHHCLLARFPHLARPGQARLWEWIETFELSESDRARVAAIRQQADRELIELQREMAGLIVEARRRDDPTAQVAPIQKPGTSRNYLGEVVMEMDLDVRQHVRFASTVATRRIGQRCRPVMEKLWPILGGSKETWQQMVNFFHQTR